MDFNRTLNSINDRKENKHALGDLNYEFAIIDIIKKVLSLVSFIASIMFNDLKTMVIESS